jgi:hypothetical protein
MRAGDALAGQLIADGGQIIREPDKLDTPGGYGFRFFDIDGRVVEVSADVATRTAAAGASGHESEAGTTRRISSPLQQA